jgi:carbon starvation protein
MGRAKYAWATVLPLTFVTVTTMTAGFLSVRDNFWPLTLNPATAVTGYVDSIATVVMMSCMVLILVQSVKRCLQVIGGRAPIAADPAPERA